jgi:hypothetical protein
MTIQTVLKRAADGEWLFGEVPDKPVEEWSQSEIENALQDALLITREANRRLDLLLTDLSRDHA